MSPYYHHRSKAEQDYVQALIRFHNRNMEGLCTAIKQEKRVQANKKQINIVTKTTAFARSAPKETVKDINVTKVSKRIEELKAEIMSLSTILNDNNKQKRDYTCLHVGQCLAKTNSSNKAMLATKSLKQAHVLMQSPSMQTLVYMYNLSFPT